MNRLKVGDIVVFDWSDRSDMVLERDGHLMGVTEKGLSILTGTLEVTEVDGSSSSRVANGEFSYWVPNRDLKKVGTTC